MSEQENDMSWQLIQQDFNKLQSLDEIYVFLNNKMHKWNICNNLQCDAFHSLSRLEKRIDSLPYTVREEGLKIIKNQVDRKLFEKAFDKTMRYAKRILRELYAMKTTIDTQTKQSETYHQRNLDTINALIKSNYPIPVEAAQGINDYLSYNSQMGETSEELRVYNEKLKKEREKRRKMSKESKK